MSSNSVLILVYRSHQELTCCSDWISSNWNPPDPQDLAGVKVKWKDAPGYEFGYPVQVEEEEEAEKEDEEEETETKLRLWGLRRWCGTKTRMCLTKLKKWLRRLGGKKADEEVGEDEEGEDEALKEERFRVKWEVLRQPVIPEATFKDIDYAPVPGKRLTERFAKSGLQIIIKIASIELTPEKPKIPYGGWHVSYLEPRGNLDSY